MPTDKRRISLIVDEDVFRVLALDPEEHGATPVSAALSRYADHIARASARVASRLDRAEWNALADVLNGCADLWDYAGFRMTYLMLVRAEVEDGIQLVALDEKWHLAERGKVLLRKLARMTELEGDAIAAAIRFFLWACSHGNTIDHAVDEWWTLAYRTRPEAGADRATDGPQ